MNGRMDTDQKFEKSRERERGRDSSTEVVQNIYNIQPDHEY